MRLAKRRDARINEMARKKDVARQHAIANARERSEAHSVQKDAKVMRQKITDLNAKIKAKRVLLENARREKRYDAVSMFYAELKELEKEKIDLRADLRKLTPAVDKERF